MHTSIYMILYIFLRLKHCKSFTWGSPQPRAQLYWREGLGHTRSQKATAGKLFFNALFCPYHKNHRFNFKHCVDPSYQTYCCVITKVFSLQSEDLPVLASCSPTRLVPYPERKPRTGVPRHPYEPQASPGFKQFEIWWHEEEEQR